jgi:putative membrane protein
LIADGASGLSSGLAQYTGGVSDLSNGLYQLEDGASGLASGVGGYTGGVSQLSGSLTQLNQGIQLNPTVDPAIKAGLQQVVDGLAGAAANGPALASGAAQLSDGVSQSVDGAAQLSANGPALVTGAAQLASGATDLSAGLREGATQLSGADTPAGDPDIAADPVTLSVTTDNEVSQVGQLVATFFVPLGLWIGALAVFLVLRPLTRRALTSTARNGRLVFSGLARASAVTGAQAVLLTVLLHAGLGVSWSLLPATLGFSLLMALAFTAFHYLLTIGLGRAGLVVSLFVLAVQVTSTGGIYPVEVLSAPFQAISPFLPLTWAVEGMQGIIAGGSVGGVVAASLVLAAFGAGSALVALLAIRRTRRATALGLVPQLG